MRVCEYACARMCGGTVQGGGHHYCTGTVRPHVWGYGNGVRTVVRRSDRAPACVGVRCSIHEPKNG
ncbi:MAG: hypothetical protein ACRDD1_14285, partial [Planctomycetia bacterium]